MTLEPPVPNKPGNAKTLYNFNDSGGAGALPQHFPNQEKHRLPYISNDSGAAGWRPTTASPKPWNSMHSQ